MNELEAFLADIHRHPDEDALPLILADRLQDRETPKAINQSRRLRALIKCHQRIESCQPIGAATRSILLSPQPGEGPEADVRYLLNVVAARRLLRVVQDPCVRRLVTTLELVWCRLDSRVNLWNARQAAREALPLTLPAGDTLNRVPDRAVILAADAFDVAPATVDGRAGSAARPVVVVLAADAIFGSGPATAQAASELARAMGGIITDTLAEFGVCPLPA
jgi:uncharacterized protein (TIGR02996 family)